MLNLNLKNNITILSLMFFWGCTTLQNTQVSFFTVKRELSGVVEIVATPDRVLLECVKSEEDPDEGRYGFMIHMLDEENTVTTSLLSIRPDKKNCEGHIKKISRILKKAKSVYIGNRGGHLTTDPRVEDRKFSHTFPGHGTFYSNGRSLDFGLIANDKGECYNPMVRDNEPCLEYPFPIEKYENELGK